MHYGTLLIKNVLFKREKNLICIMENKKNHSNPLWKFLRLYNNDEFKGFYQGEIKAIHMYYLLWLCIIDFV